MKKVVQNLLLSLGKHKKEFWILLSCLDFYSIFELFWGLCEKKLHQRELELKN